MALRLLALLALFFVCFLAGCDSSSNDFVVTGAQSPQTSLTGKVQLGAAVAGAPITIESLGGQVLGQSKTNRTGSFALTTSLPTDFRVVAQIGDDKFSTEVRGYSGARYVVVNVPTTLVSLLVQQGRSLEDAQASVAGYLHVPSNRSLEYGIEESARAPFSHLAFLAAAARNGGWSPFSQALIAQLGSGGNGTGDLAAPYLLTEDVAEQPISGLERSLQDALNSLRLKLIAPTQTQAATERLYKNFNRAAGAFDRQESASPELQGIRPSVVSSILEIAEDEAKEQLIDIGWTHIADACNLNYGTTTMLEEVQQALADVLDGLSDLSKKVAQYHLEEASDAVGDEVSSIQTSNNTLQQLTYQDGVPQNVPHPANTTLQSFIVANLQIATLQTNIATIQGEMLGTGGESNIITENRDNLYQNDLGISNSEFSMGYAPVRNNNQIQERLMTSFLYYGSAQLLGSNLLGEGAHTTEVNPASNIQVAANDIVGNLNSLKSQRNQLPQSLPSDQLVLDLQGGLMWYSEVQSFENMSVDEANHYAANLVVDCGNGVVYSDWRLPTDNEIKLLQDRGRLVSVDRRNPEASHDGSNSDYGNYGYSVAGLQALGFTNTEIINSDGTVLAVDWTYHNTVIGGNYWESEYIQFLLNHETINSEEPTTDISGFFVVRNIGKPVFEEDGSNTDGTYPFPFSYPGPAEFTTLGHMTGLSQTFAASTSQAGAKATFKILTGGSFEMGTDEASDSRDLPSYTYTQDVETGSSDAGPVNLLDLIWFTSSNTALLTIDPKGRFLWHTDTNLTSQSVAFSSNALVNGANVTNQGTLTDSPSARTVKALQIFPRNKQYILTTPGSSQTDNYYCLVYYSDDTVKDVTSQTTFEALDDSTGQPTSPTAARFSTSTNAEGTFTIFDTAPPLVRLTAKWIQNGKTYTDQTLAEPVK